MTLDSIFGNVKKICYQDDRGAYLNGEMVALDNSRVNGYIRRNGARSLTRVGGCQGDYDSELPLVFVGAYPGGNVDLLERATIAALTSKDNFITEVVTDKLSIAESEKIAVEELSKFDNVAMIWVSYTSTTKEVYDPNCTYQIC